MTDTLGVFHEMPKIGILRIISPSVEMRRAVRVREILHGECVGNEMIDTADHHMVEDPLHLFEPFSPAVCPKHLTHGAPAFFRIETCERNTETGQSIVEEFTVIGVDASDRMERIIIEFRTELLKDDINACHVLPPKSSKIVRSAQTELGMTSVVLNDMPDIFDSVRTAPVADLPAEVFPVEVSDLIGEEHTVCTGLRTGCCIGGCKQGGEADGKVRSPGFPETLLEFGTPGKGNIGLTCSEMVVVLG